MVKDKEKQNKWTTAYVIFTPKLKEKIKIDAKKNFRTIDGQIRFIIEKYYEKNKECEE